MCSLCLPVGGQHSPAVCANTATSMKSEWAHEHAQDVQCGSAHLLSGQHPNPACLRAPVHDLGKPPNSAAPPARNTKRCAITVLRSMVGRRPAPNVPYVPQHAVHDTFFVLLVNTPPSTGLGSRPSGGHRTGAARRSPKLVPGASAWAPSAAPTQPRPLAPDPPANRFAGGAQLGGHGVRAGLADSRSVMRGGSGGAPARGRACSFLVVSARGAFCAARRAEC